MKKIITFLFVLGFGFGFSQKTIPEVLQRYNKNTVPYITVNELKNRKGIVLLDAREQKEYDVSHLEKAIYVGHTKFNSKSFEKQFPNKQSKIVVYCSLGVRSEQIGEKLINLGYTNVENLYGGIFEWKNQDNLVVDNNNETTESVHAFSKEWGKYLTKGTKIYIK
jgi:rhodanese-related sulfurtransferase